MSDEELPIALTRIRASDYQLADFQYEILMESIKEYEEELNEDEEVAVQLASFGQTIFMQVTSIGYANPSLIFFNGYVNGQRSQLIQHISQLNFLLTSSRKQDSEKPARRIGFNVNPGEED